MDIHQFLYGTSSSSGSNNLGSSRFQDVESDHTHLGVITSDYFAAEFQAMHLTITTEIHFAYRHAI